MRIIKTRGKRGTFWTVNGVASCGQIDAAVHLAIDSLCEIVAAAPVHTLWTVYA